MPPPVEGLGLPRVGVSFVDDVRRVSERVDRGSSLLWIPPHEASLIYQGGGKPSALRGAKKKPDPF